SIKKNRFSNLNIELLVYPKEDGTVWDKKSKNFDWEVEDFLPNELMFDSVNKILKNAKYSIIKKKLRDNKSKAANLNTQIFMYAENAAKLENPDKAPFQLSGEGQKKSICLEVVKLLSNKVYELTEAQVTFLSEICES
ncbi:hypothetical protein, partial [Pseudoalteromonas sp. SR45-5]|uniref:hypothetical protein n=1 Tax=Pseudoalteromonas sp. SR45-5 TaxID=2760928 RepID=UPI0015FBF9CA